LPDGCIVTCDSGSTVNWYARDLKFRRGMMGSLSGGLATMGPAIPYAIAAKLAHPGRPVIALQGDGAMQMNGLNGLITIASHWREWSDPRLIVMVLNNGDLNQVTWEQRVMAGDPKYEASQQVPGFNYAEYARMLGLIGLKVTRTEDIGPAWEEALASSVPTVLEMVTDPNVPPLPPHLGMDQARAFLSALWHRDPDALAVIKNSARQWWASMFP
jgi:pyruvate dehydrogenase (quinone)